MESWRGKDLSKKENQHNEWRGKMLRDMSDKSKKFVRGEEEQHKQENSSKTDTQANECS